MGPWKRVICMGNENIISMLKSDEMISKYKDDETFKKNLLDFKIPYREKLKIVFCKKTKKHMVALKKNFRRKE